MLFDLDAQKYNQNNSATLLNFFKPTLTFFGGHDLGFKLVFGFGPELAGPFTTLRVVLLRKDIRVQSVQLCRLV